MSSHHDPLHRSKLEPKLQFPGYYSTRQLGNLLLIRSLLPSSFLNLMKLFFVRAFSHRRAEDSLLLLHSRGLRTGTLVSRSDHRSASSFPLVQQHRESSREFEEAVGFFELLIARSGAESLFRPVWN